MYYKYFFTAEIEKYDFEKYFYTVVFLPPELASCLPFGGSKRLRIEAEIDCLVVQAALMPSKGRWYLMVSRRILKQIGKSLGDEIEVRFNIAHQDAVEIPEKLQGLLEESPEIKQRWDALSSGKQRGLAYRFSQAKTEQTQIKRWIELKNFLLEVSEDK